MALRRELAACLALSTVLLGCGDDGEGSLGVDTKPSRADGSDGGRVSERCRAQCELAAGACVERELDAFESFDETLALWSQRCPDAGEARSFPFVVAGRCRDGMRVLYTGGGFTTERRYFDATGSFIALTTGTDVVDQECGGRGYWPEPVVCEAPVITAVHCGRGYEVGATF